MSKFSLQEVVDILNNDESYSTVEENDSYEAMEMEGTSSDTIDMTETDSNNNSLNKQICNLNESCVSEISSVEPISVIISDGAYNHQELDQCMVFWGQDLSTSSLIPNAQSCCDKPEGDLNLSVSSEETDSSAELEIHKVTNNENNNVTKTDYPDNSENRSRKRQRNPETWKEAIRKRRRQSGLEYTSSRGKVMRKREMKTFKDCQGSCKFKCAQMFTSNEREQIFLEFWQLTDEEKSSYYANTTDKQIKDRQRTKAENSRRKSSVKYYFVKGIDRIRVCKEFYFSTLDISSKRVHYFYKKIESGAKLGDQRGKPSKQKVAESAREYLRNHIKSFPRIPSHYCRSSSNAEYLEPHLSVAEMYRMYKEKCNTDGVDPQTLNFYRNTFNNEFNCRFQKPKKDRCDICEEYKQLNEKVPIMETKYNDHIKDKEATAKERETDRNNTNEHELVVCFDMQNVITCPRSNVSNFFYKRKLSVFNMTGHCSIDKTAYNIIWSEQVAGRGSNELASAVLVILDQVVAAHPQTTCIILWSDSCVAQNRNRIMCYALKTFLLKHPDITITQKFCTPGHSSIQEIDNVHSHIERRLKVSEIYSPLSLMRLFKKVRPEKMIVIQLRPEQIYHFENAASQFTFKDIPFFRVKALRLLGSLPLHVQYKTGFNSDYVEVCISRTTRSAKKSSVILVPRLLSKQAAISDAKKKDIKSMLKFMPTEDQLYMKKLCNL